MLIALIANIYVLLIMYYNVYYNSSLMKFSNNKRDKIEVLNEKDIVIFQEGLCCKPSAERVFPFAIV